MGSRIVFLLGFQQGRASRGVYPLRGGAINGRSLAMLNARLIQKMFNNMKIIILCGFVTILIFRGTIGVGNLGGQDTGDGGASQ